MTLIDPFELVALAPCGCIYGWSSCKPTMRISDLQKFTSNALSLGYRIERVPVGQHGTICVTDCSHVAPASAASSA